MQDLDKTTRYVVPTDVRRAMTRALILTVFDAAEAPREYDLSSFGKTSVTFGRGGDNDIVLTSPLVSHHHGRFICGGGVWRIEDLNSTNGLIYNDAAITGREVGDGDFIRIDDGVETIRDGVLLVFSSPESSNRWETLPTQGKGQLTVGRDPGCEIVLNHVSVSKRHAVITHEGDGWYIRDNSSTNGLLINGRRGQTRERLHEKDVVAITNSKLIFTSSAIYYCCYRSGISVDAADIVIRRGRGRKQFTTSNHVSVSVKPGELVGIIGGSGAGKSTLLNCMCGYLPPTHGNVYINGIDLYKNFDALKKLIGYVPQSDIVYDNLTLYDMLKYTAKLRLPEDTTKAEREAAITRAIEAVELTDKRKQLIRSLSGGQRKRASIAVELLSDPNLLFLDEPASGLDPGTERNLMHTLRGMADGGKTVILVTHSTLQLKMCDKIVFMGKGGNLCFYGGYDDALKFFGVDDIVDVYNMITDNAKQWKARFAETLTPAGKPRDAAAPGGHTKPNRLRQLRVLSARYMKLVFNDRQRLLLLLVQAPLLALLISFVADGNEFQRLEITKSLLFALSCSAFWIGMLNAIQEVCKERTILKREYMTGLSVSSYIASKILVLGGLCLIQSAMVVGVFSVAVGLPDEGLMIHPAAEMMITTFLTAVASASMGLMVSSLFTNADRAMTVAPILLMPQILFSGMIFTLEGATKVISWFAVCRWSMEGYGTTANLNALPNRLQLMGIPNSEHVESFYEFKAAHLLEAWGILLVFTVVCLVVAKLVLNRIGKEKA